MRKLQHHNVVSYISCANIGKSHFIIIMEYVSGGSLKHVLETFGPPPLPAVRKYVTDLLRGLKYLHDNGMIHCDIKPHNALLTPDGSVKLSDFGSSVNVTLYGGQNADGDEQVLVRGTSYYLAPEACRNEITSAVDIWSVGVTVLELLTGRLPWEIKGSEANFIRELGKNEDMRPMIPADIPSNAAAFCKMCLHRDPAMRPTADALLRTPFLSG
jgi:serine/threonine protein kinase